MPILATAIELQSVISNIVSLTSFNFRKRLTDYYIYPKYLDTLPSHQTYPKT